MLFQVTLMIYIWKKKKFDPFDGIKNIYLLPIRLDPTIYNKCVFSYPAYTITYHLECGQVLLPPEVLLHAWPKCGQSVV